MLNESQNIEYKLSWRDEYLKWICGFANANGGVINIGINDDKKVVGVDDVNRLMEEIPNKIVSHLGIVADVNLLISGKLEYIEIVVSPSNIPIAYKGQYYYRSGATKQELKGVALQEFIMKKMGRSWDDISLEYASVDDIDRNAINFFLRRSVIAGRMYEDEEGLSTEDILKNLGLIASDGKLKNAAILLFGKHVRQYFPSVEFKIGRFHTNECDLITQDIIEGNIIQMANKVVEVLRTKYLISPIRYKGMQRIEDLEIPERALREILYNAIVHKDYTGPSIQMRIYDDTIEIWNYGLLPLELTPRDLLRRHASYPRNKNLAYTFFKAGFIESWGRGFKKIQEEFERVGLSMPVIQEVDGGVMVMIKRRTLEEIISTRSIGIEKDVSINAEDVSINAEDVSINAEDVSINAEDVSVNAENVSVNAENVSINTENAIVFSDNGSSVLSEACRKLIGKQTENMLTGRQCRICNMIQVNPHITVSDISAALSVADRTIYRDMNLLQRAAILRREGTNRDGIWVIIERKGNVGE